MSKTIVAILNTHCKSREKKQFQGPNIQKPHPGRALKDPPYESARDIIGDLAISQAAMYGENIVIVKKNR
jgi:hypothetical protein